MNNIIELIACTLFGIAGAVGLFACLGLVLAIPEMGIASQVVCLVAGYWIAGALRAALAS
jgi:uncharacterized membrane protein YjjP (DUF1212 family)